MNARRLTDSPALPAWPHAESLDRDLPESLRGIVIDEPVADAMAALAQEVHDVRRSIEVSFALWGTSATSERHAQVVDVQPLDTKSSLGSVEIAPNAFVTAVEALAARHTEGEVIGVVHTHPGDAIPARSCTDRIWHSRLLDDHHRQSLCFDLPLATEAGAAVLTAQTFYSVVMNESAEIDRATSYLLLRVRDGLGFADVEYEIPLFLASGAPAGRGPRVTAEVTEASGWSYDVRFVDAAEGEGCLPEEFLH
jgi:proteasome lid subunit RPN8/RPN11